LFGLHPSNEHASIYTEDELRQLIDVSHQSGHLEKEEKQLINRVFDFSETAVGEAMVPRPSVTAIEISSTLDQTRKLFRTSGYSRLPVYREHNDNVVGILSRRDIEPFLENPGQADFSLEGLLHPALFIPVTARLGGALRHMQSSRTHLAIVVDEHGGMEGIVTLEDVLEEIVGEINDEFDEEVRSQILKESNGTYVVSGMLSVRDANRKLKLNLPEDGGYTTVAGFLLDQAGRLLAEGETVEYEGATFNIVRVDKRRISRIRFVPAAEVKSMSSLAILSLLGTTLIEPLALVI
jgi:CBS domain containing-hemolysin-like protein